MIKFGFIGSMMAVASLLLASCGQQPVAAVSQVQQVSAPQPKLYAVSATTVQDCQNDPSNVNPQLCAQAFASAQAQVTHYNSYDSCHAYGYNDCTNYGSYWGPMLTGFMLSSVMTHGYYGAPVVVLHGGYYGGYYGHALNYGAPPIYSNGHYVISHTTIVSQHASVSAPTVTRGGIGPTASRTASVSAPTAAATVTRGGFGSGSGSTYTRSTYHSSPSSSSSFHMSSGGSRRR